MIRALWRRGRADLRNRPLHTLLLLVVVTIAATGIVAGLSSQAGAEERWDKVFAEANGAHVVIFGGPDLPAAEIAAAPEVVESSGPFASLGASLASDAGRASVVIRGVGSTLPTVTTPLLTDGRWLHDRGLQEMVVDRAFALDRGISVGERVMIEADAGEETFQVVGLAIDTVDCLYPQCDPGRTWALPETVERLAGEDAPGAVMMVRLAEPDAVGAYAADLLGRFEQARGVNDWQDTRDDVLVTNRFFGFFLAAFGAVLLVAAGLVVASTITARMFAQYREIGLLKSIGFTPRSIGTLILVEHLLIGLVGVVLGWLIGWALAPSLQLRVAEVLDPGRPGVSFASLVVALAIVLGLIVVSTVVPAWRAGRVPASEAIVRGAAPRNPGTSRLARLANRVGIGPVGAVGVKDAFARPFRASFMILALTVSVVAALVALGFNATVDEVTTDRAKIGDPWDVVVIPSETLAGSELAAILDDTPEVGSWYGTAERRVGVEDGTLTARALVGDLASSGFVIRDGRMIDGPEEATVGYALLERLGVDIGDRTTIEVGGAPLELSVVGWFATAEDSGEILLFHLDGLRTVEPNAQVGAWFASAAAGVEPAELASALSLATGGQARIRFGEAFDDLDAFRAAFAVIALLVLAVGLVNVFSATVQSMRERTRDIAVLKTLGFTPAQVVRSAATGAAALAAIAAVAGIALGYLVYWLLMDEVARQIGVGPGLRESPSAVAVVLLLPIVVLLTAALAALAARHPANAQVADVLREE